MSIFDEEDDLPPPDPDSWEEGWHYTSWTNWELIRTVGLTPTLLSADKIAAVTEIVDPQWDGKAVWVWINRLTPIEHMGSVIYQLAKRSETTLVTLKVRYQFKQRLAPLPETGGTKLQLRHRGNIDRLKYHHRTLSCLVTEPIPPENITLVKTYDLLRLLELEAG